MTIAAPNLRRRSIGTRSLFYFTTTRTRAKLVMRA